MELKNNDDNNIGVCINSAAMMHLGLLTPKDNISMSESSTKDYDYNTIINNNNNIYIYGCYGNINVDNCVNNAMMIPL